ncbi:hypothetical protein [Cytobacillus massiliigabonensis]|uniref:hypothetical protein n=1 Tax=Cytobacillus massiliigabonensis TaxID=1871011 RepID=UPI000C8161AA|nr:hypothetical protein [Cytobacillus massiliigabonensis]
MEFSINLLPQTNSRKEKRSVYFIPVLGIVAFAASTSFFAYNYFETKNAVQSLKESIATQTDTRNDFQKEYQSYTTGVTEYNYTERYRLLDQYLNNIYENPITLQDRINQLLPDQAKVNAYTYLNTGELTVTVTFNSKGDSAIFLHRLLNANFVEHAQVDSIIADEEEIAYETLFQIKLNTLVGEQ